MLIMSIHFNSDDSDMVVNQKKTSGFVGTALACTFRIMSALLFLDCM